jgi:predicted ATP-grasp superfamily ATP-dependent carboligase
MTPAPWSAPAAAAPAAPACIVVAALCARPLAESARHAGWRVIALDLFGDADTRRVSVRWERVGDAARLAIDPTALRSALQRAAREPGVIGWVAGSGFESLPAALDLRIPGLPLLGMDASAVRRVRDPVSFFEVLDRLGLAHPGVAFAAPADPDGWLAKCAAGCGGWHIHRARACSASADGVYWQRLQPGEPMSALFLADGTQARVIALNRLIVRPQGDLPYLFGGALGPIHDEALAAQMQRALAQLVPALGLRGLASLDFLAHEGQAFLLEINARPSASMVLHERAWPGGLLQAHVRAMQGHLPQDPPTHAPGVRGCLTVYADRPCRVGLALAADLAQAADCHDLPAPGARFGAGEPVCSVSAAGAHPDAVLAELDLRAGRIRHRFGSAQELVA